METRTHTLVMDVCVHFLISIPIGLDEKTHLKFCLFIINILVNMPVRCNGRKKLSNTNQKCSLSINFENYSLFYNKLRLAGVHRPPPHLVATEIYRAPTIVHLVPTRRRCNLGRAHMHGRRNQRKKLSFFPLLSSI
jgi:hypothetical protein